MFGQFPAHAVVLGAAQQPRTKYDNPGMIQSEQTGFSSSIAYIPVHGN